MSIPAQLHFLFIGPRLPWPYAFAVLSASARGGLDRIVLHHTDALDDDDAPSRAVRDAPGVELRRLDADSVLRAAGARAGLGDRLVELHARLDRPVLRSDVLRVALVFLHGGLYLDCDTVTVASLLPLTDAPAFVGTEHVVWPQAARRRRTPLVLARHGTLDLVRAALRALPSGWRAFRAIERLYPVAINNAAFGAEPGSAVLARLLCEMAAMPPARRLVLYALGPWLWQDVVAREGIVVHPPAVFAPLGPEIASHWFALRRRVRLAPVLRPETRVVHWYASGLRAGAITPETIRQNQGRQLYSALVCRALPCTRQGTVVPWIP